MASFWDTVLGKTPKAPDFQQIAADQRAANRPTQTNPFGGQTQYTQADSGFNEAAPSPVVFDRLGNATINPAWARWNERKQQAQASAPWQQQTSFEGPLGDAAESLAGQAGQQLGTPMDWAQFGTLGTGDEARQQAIDAAYNQATKRLDPMFAQRESAQATQLANQGLDPNSQAARAARAEMAANRNDAYGSAMNSAIAQGTAAGESVFRQNMMSRQQAIAEALKRRGQPVDEMRAMLPLLGMPGVPQDNSQLTAAGMQYGADMNAFNAQQQAYGDILGGGLNVANSAFNWFAPTPTKPQGYSF